ncbi:MAG: hypothetical protein IT536_16005 [Hyphomicrobiales bacterium]|nr:hypothetical protein [Hyphomicrobiales bacterium]
MLAGANSDTRAESAGCAQIAASIASEQALERRARDDLKAIVQGWAISTASRDQLKKLAENPEDYQGIGSNVVAALQRTQARIARHAGNVQRLQAHYARNCRTPTVAGRPVPSAPRVATRPVSGRPIAAPAPRVFGYPNVAATPVRRTAGVHRAVHRTSTPRRVVTVARPAPRRHVVRPGVIRDPAR